MQIERQHRKQGWIRLPRVLDQSPFGGICRLGSCPMAHGRRGVRRERRGSCVTIRCSIARPGSAQFHLC
jgi:hypothetical protein